MSDSVTLTNCNRYEKYVKLSQVMSFLACLIFRISCLNIFEYLPAASLCINYVSSPTFADIFRTSTSLKVVTDMLRGACISIS